MKNASLTLADPASSFPVWTGASELPGPGSGWLHVRFLVRALPCGGVLPPSFVGGLVFPSPASACSALVRPAGFCLDVRACLGLFGLACCLRLVPVSAALCGPAAGCSSAGSPSP